MDSARRLQGLLQKELKENLIMSATTIREAQLRVLVAEDNPVNQMYTALLVEKQGHIAHVVGNGQLALDAMLNETFDVVLMDIGMPVMNGFEAVERLRQWERVTQRRVPVIAVTASTSALDGQRCLASGMDSFIRKPVRAGELSAALHRVFHDGKGTSMDADSAEAAEAEPVARPATACDLSAALKQLNGDDGFLQQLAQLFLDTVPDQLRMLKSAVQGCKGHLTADLAHSVKGSVRHFFAVSAYDAALRLELTGPSENWPLIERTYERLVTEVARMRTELLTSFPSLH